GSGPIPTHPISSANAPTLDQSAPRASAPDTTTPPVASQVVSPGSPAAGVVDYHPASLLDAPTITAVLGGRPTRATGAGDEVLTNQHDMARLTDSDNTPTAVVQGTGLTESQHSGAAPERLTAEEIKVDAGVDGSSELSGVGAGAGGLDGSAAKGGSESVDREL